jgi:hypothetical protein
MGLPIRKERPSHESGSRFEALANKEAGDAVDLVHTSYKENLHAEYKDGYLAYLVIIR